MPITSDCSTAMIKPGDRLIVVGGDAPYARVVDVVGVERRRRERQPHAERAHEQLRRAHVNDRAHPVQAQAARGSVRAGATSRASRPGGRRCARARARPDGAARGRRRPGRARSRSRPRIGGPRRRDCANTPARSSSSRTARVMGRRITFVNPRIARIGTRSSSSMCWIMCMKKSWSASASIGETSAISASSSEPRKQHSRQIGASARGRADAPRRTCRQRET